MAGYNTCLYNCRAVLPGLPDDVMSRILSHSLTDITHYSSQLKTVPVSFPLNILWVRTIYNGQWDIIL